MRRFFHFDLVLRLQAVDEFQKGLFQPVELLLLGADDLVELGEQLVLKGDFGLQSYEALFVHDRIVPYRPLK